MTDDDIMTKSTSKQKPAKPKPLSPDLAELLHMITSLEKQPLPLKAS
jgi:hypothetical protein